MHEEEEQMPRFIACKRRNVAAAYARFLGPSAGVFPEPWHSRTWAGLIRMLRIPPVGIADRAVAPAAAAPGADRPA
jgi:hypothetical protein